jgi:hypothetical protein
MKMLFFKFLAALLAALLRVAPTASAGVVLLGEDKWPDCSNAAPLNVTNDGGVTHGTLLNFSSSALDNGTCVSPI